MMNNTKLARIVAVVLVLLLVATLAVSLLG